MNALLDHWKKWECPIINGVIFSDGMIYPIQPVDAPRRFLPLALHHDSARRITPTEFIAWTHATPLCECVDQSKGIFAVAGEGAMGADGFIAFLNPDRSLRWIAFFDFSNPFVALRLQGRELVAANNQGEHWRVPTLTPWKITIEGGRTKPTASRSDS